MNDQNKWFYKILHFGASEPELLTMEDIIGSISSASNEWNSFAAGRKKKCTLVERFIVADSESSTADLNLLAIKLAGEKEAERLKAHV